MREEGEIKRQDGMLDTESDSIAIQAERFSAPVRWLLMGLALISLGVGFIGLFLPGLPTTEFVLLAAWAASLSSPKLYCWIVEHKQLGPLLKHWKKGQLPRKAKWMATFTMSLAAVLMIVTHFPLGVWGTLALLCMAGVLVWLWSKPEPSEELELT